MQVPERRDNGGNWVRGTRSELVKEGGGGVVEYLTTARCMCSTPQTKPAEKDLKGGGGGGVSAQNHYFNKLSAPPP